MSKDRRSDLIIGIILLAIGGWFLAAEFNLLPKLSELINLEYSWPLIIIGIGVFLFLLGLITRNPGLSVPACIVGGIGGILTWTSTTGNWGDWTFLWTLIPGFVGIGVILSTLLGGESKRGYAEGLKLIVISAVLFILFVTNFSGRANLIQYWPILVIIAGIWIIVQTVFRKK